MVQAKARDSKSKAKRRIENERPASGGGVAVWKSATGKAASQHRADAGEQIGVEAGTLFRNLYGKLASSKRSKLRLALAKGRVWEAISLAITADIPDAQAPSTALAAALARGAQHKHDLIEKAGGLLSSKAVAEMLQITPQAVHKRYSQDKLLAVPATGGDLGYPAIQFTSGAVTDGLEPVLKAIGVKDQWMRLNWLLATLPELGDTTPIDAVKEGRGSEVADAAASYGEHGAS